jgi:YcxB-like protein
LGSRGTLLPAKSPLFVADSTRGILAEGGCGRECRLSEADWERITLNYELSEEEFLDFHFHSVPVNYRKLGLFLGLVFGTLLPLGLKLQGIEIFGLTALEQLLGSIFLGIFLGFVCIFEIWLLVKHVTPAIYGRRYRRTGDAEVPRCYLFSEEKVTQIFQGRALVIHWDTVRRWRDLERFLAFEVGPTSIPLPKRVMNPEQESALKALFCNHVGEPGVRRGAA